MVDSISIPGPLMVGKKENAFRMVIWNDPGGVDLSPQSGHTNLHLLAGIQGSRQSVPPPSTVPMHSFILQNLASAEEGKGDSVCNCPSEILYAPRQCVVK